MLAEIENRAAEEAERKEKGQLELFSVLLSDLADRKRDGRESNDAAEPKRDVVEHRVTSADGQEYVGSWERIVRAMRDANRAFAGRSVQEFMATEARRGYSLTGVKIPTSDAESFIRGSADAGLLRIVR